jgi:outer membrane protein assembly factor BamD
MYPEDRLSRADDLMSEGKCAKAIIEYEQVLSEYPRPEIAERAKFSLAQCRMNLEEYDLAIQDFEVFIDSHPKSGMLDDAMYMIALCYLRQSPRPERDQSETMKALNELNLLIREYPDTDVREQAEQAIIECRSKLAQKDYLNGELYLKMGHYKSARIYFDAVMAHYGETAWAPRALLAKGITYAKENDPDKARQAFEQVLTDFPSSDVTRQAADRLKELEGATGATAHSSAGQ